MTTILTYPLEATGHDLRWTQNGEPCCPCKRCEAAESTRWRGRPYPYCVECDKLVNFFELLHSERATRRPG